MRDQFTLDIARHSLRCAKKLLSFASLVFACASPAIAAAPPEEAMFKQLAALAGSGNAEVKYNLAMFYNNGIGTSRDNKTAFRYFSEAAQAGNLLASYKVGCYYAGQFAGIVPLDEHSALKYKLAAAEAGYDLAQHDVAMHFGQKGDVDKALMWLERASRQAYMPSTVYLAYYLSRPESKDKVKGLALMLFVAERKPDTPKELSGRLAAEHAQLSEAEKLQVKQIQDSWLTGRTPLSTAARAGISAVPALLRSFEQ